jgi:hypothetical protein
VTVVQISVLMGWGTLLVSFLLTFLRVGEKEDGR